MRAASTPGPRGRRPRPSCGHERQGVEERSVFGHKWILSSPCDNRQRGCMPFTSGSAGSVREATHLVLSDSPARGQLTSFAASRTAWSMSFELTSSSLAMCFSAFKLGLVERRFERGLSDDHERGLACVDELAELLDVGTRHALPQVAAHTTDTRADNRAANERGREQDPDDRAGRGAAPRAVARGRLILVDVHLSVLVLGDHRSVVRPDGPAACRSFTIS